MRNLKFIPLGNHLFAYDCDRDALYIFSAQRQDWVEYPGVPRPDDDEYESGGSIPTDVDDAGQVAQDTDDGEKKKRQRVEYTPEFNEFWTRYRYHCTTCRTRDGDMPSPGAKFKAFTEWRKLNPADRLASFRTVETWFGQTDFPCHGERYLKHRRWEDVDTATAPKPPVDRLATVRRYVEENGFEETAAEFGLDAASTDDLLGLLLTDDDAMRKILGEN